jgi:hypothetical protein
MSRRRSSNTFEEDLQELQDELRLFTLLLREVREREALRLSPTTIPRGIEVDDRVSFRIFGTGEVRGVVVSKTAKRVCIRQDGTTATYQRAPHNVTRLE